MKYTFYYTDNNNARSRGYEQDKFFRKTFNLENDREVLRKVLEIQNQANYDEFNEKFDKASLKELKDWAYDNDISGDPVVFYVENAQGKIIYDSKLDMEDWMTDEDKIEDLDESREKMKYRFYWTDNEHAYSRTEGDDEFNDDTLDLENDREALKEVLYTQGQFNEDDEDDVERFENSSLAELEEWANEIDVGFGSPVVFWVKNRNGKLVYDSGLDPDNWNY